MPPSGRIPEATVARLPLYLQALVQASEQGTSTLSSEALAQASGVNSAKVRKDLSQLGSYGTRGVGYRVDELIGEISEVLGLTRDRPVVIVGIGNLGRALASYAGFTRRGFSLAALIDADPSKIGTEVGGRTVESLDDLASIVAERHVSIAVLATPAAAAQAVADALVDAGINAILNFAPVHVTVPGRVPVRTVDLSTELQILSFYEQLHGGRLGPTAG
ncbi:MAG: redox-sensing transcriptional repressor Rex [Actinobacteria bacterium]|nr:redox-sensing transcriptional repressor Rex [Actinomycetota bacterium]